MERKARWLEKYPDAHCWAFGDSPALADELAALVIAGKKRGTCGSQASFQAEARAVKPGDYHIVLNGRGEPACVIRTLSLTLVRFNEVSEAQAALEGEGDLSLNYWRSAHRQFFEREGGWSPEMELVYETFALIASA
ncbi:ASCH domain-containing protein [Pluralibacter gergoviae]|uniref:ASCH domain-containing protein n=1 Tax=Pluralibacter gergoviae TaxID=61647 RepID=UPI0008DC2C90|nr:ASCH domain-containing protein [Pluralibacter gergoviae]EKW6620879.1 ASCH domain-containing protein [Pluralibacter gergoviae]OHY62951.1 ASCH domain-containing protein [Pluralibacter gergoviae]